MAYALNNVAAPTDFSDSVCVLRCPNARTITVLINNASVYYQFSCRRHGVSSAVGSEQWEPAEGGFLLPGQFVFDSDDSGGNPFTGIRFRNALSTAPARVTALA